MNARWLRRGGRARSAALRMMVGSVGLVFLVTGFEGPGGLDGVLDDKSEVRV